MSDIASYTKTRTVAIIITVVLLLIGSIAYFSTNAAERNNEMMYKAAYGENATLPESGADREANNIQLDSDTNYKTVLA